MTDVSLVIPAIVENDLQEEILNRCLEVAIENKRDAGTEIIVIDNGSPRKIAAREGVKVIRNHKNVGVLPSFPQGHSNSTGDVVCFIHSDVLLQHPGWDERIIFAFENFPNLGLAGLFGATKLHPDGNREQCYSNMLGKEYGKCGCHEIAGYHHGNVSQDIVPVSMFDGVGLFFREEVLEELIFATDAFASWRAPHHFYDRMLSLKVAELGYDQAVLGIGFDHWSGATAGGSKIYEEAALKWLKDNKYEIMDDRQIPDQAIYNIAEKQFFDEYFNKLPLSVDTNWNYTWG